MKRLRFSGEEQIIGIPKEQEAGMGTADVPLSTIARTAMAYSQ